MARSALAARRTGTQAGTFIDCDIFVETKKEIANKTGSNTCCIKQTTATKLAPVAEAGELLSQVTLPVVA
ncbi:hypothetical protein EVAR_44197_1 [Eumeta japonica]|uniref:Uncharacterized protein n=1 Tax=Eumeta variegata TaxID=151549 RepID=A0A4C1W2F9_EUMVA|nr:hypothetical protein EVAR_44197_1 [Eumeta japonica]